MEPRPELDFAGKAGTLARLAGRLSGATVLPQRVLTVRAWRRDRRACLNAVLAEAWADGPLIARSSAAAEDGAQGSLAGRFESVGAIEDRDSLAAAIDRVIASYGAAAHGDDEVLIQPFLRGVRMAGVAFGRDPSGGGAYHIVNYDDRSGATDTVTGGRGRELKTYCCAHGNEARAPEALRPVLRLMRELAALFADQRLDVEFAVDAAGELVLLQCRPLACAEAALSPTRQLACLERIAERLDALMRPHPYLLGRQAVFGVMPDWNPAEIIGVRPRPLALSLYRDLVTDSVWAYQRDNYGYRNLRGFPLLVSLHGLPYIDVRVSFNSFVPKDIPDELANRLVNHYLDRLIAAPELHDKVEFEIIISCYTLDLEDRLAGLDADLFDAEDRAALAESLRRLTNAIIHEKTGLWRNDLAKIERLAARRRTILDSDLDPLGRIYWLLEDCRRYGTLPFAGLARAGFIAMQLLRSLVAVGILSEAELNHFLGGLNTVARRMQADFASRPRDAFLAEYGHLRPGTYDLLSPRYDEAPDSYFDWSPGARDAGDGGDGGPGVAFALTLAQMREIEILLRLHGLQHNVVGLFDFIKAGIEGREYAKFVFSRSLSDAMQRIQDFGAAHGFDADALSYGDIDTILGLYSESADPKDRLAASIARGRDAHALTQTIALPGLITAPEQVYAFHVPPSEPNFITRERIVAPVADIGCQQPLDGRIVMIPSADPGYDWIFSKPIAGFVTAYGGINSHMAIRAGEQGIPAVIGVGPGLFESWRQARRLQIDCQRRNVQILH